MTKCCNMADVGIVLALAQAEIDNSFEVARRYNDLDVEDSAKANQQTLDHVKPLLEASPNLLEALKLCREQLSLWVAEVDSCDLSPEDKEALEKATVAIAEAEGMAA